MGLDSAAARSVGGGPVGRDPGRGHPARAGQAGGAEGGVIVGLDNGGSTNNVTVLDLTGQFLVGELLESPSRVQDGPDVAIEAMAEAVRLALGRLGLSNADLLAVGLDTPGPATAEGVISRAGAVNFAHPAWRGFDVRGALERRLGRPVVYNNDGNAAALYAHQLFFGEDAGQRSSVAAIVGTGLGGGVIEAGRVVTGATGMAGELGHVPIPMEGLLEADQPRPRCNCGLECDAESVASLTGIRRNLLPYWLGRFPEHPLAGLDLAVAATKVRSYGDQGDPLARAIFAQQAQALGRLFSLTAAILDPDAYFVGGGVVEASEGFREWFLAEVRRNLTLRPEQEAVARLGLVPDLDMAGARGAALAALAALET